MGLTLEDISETAGIVQKVECVICKKREDILSRDSAEGVGLPTLATDEDWGVNFSEFIEIESDRYIIRLFSGLCKDCAHEYLERIEEKNVWKP